MIDRDKSQKETGLVGIVGKVKGWLYRQVDGLGGGGGGDGGGGLGFLLT